MITMLASSEMLVWSFRLPKPSQDVSITMKLSLCWFIKHFSMWLILPAGRQYGMAMRDCTGLQEEDRQLDCPAGSSLDLSVPICKRRLT